MTTYSATPRTELHRLPARGSYDRATVHAILDEALVCHLGFVYREQPFVIPTTFARDGETLFVHGAAASRTLKTLASGLPACVTVTLVDGLVLARTAFHHSMNYRSVVVLGTAREVTAREEKLRALSLFVEKVSPGRSSRVRAPNEKELHATSVLALGLDEVSAKVRTGMPKDEDGEDASFPVWAGVVPVALRAASLVEESSDAARYDAPAVPGALLRATDPIV
jgi:nitroimidazol reductase NimA-like FMN-containing flavoprotein (pyridoxamine 5'-phosphate oxidase superfamily)